jgi:hypothetical protein
MHRTTYLWLSVSDLCLPGSNHSQAEQQIQDEGVLKQFQSFVSGGFTILERFWHLFALRLVLNLIGQRHTTGFAIRGEVSTTAVTRQIFS